MSLKKALLVGINAYAESPLRGCINDVMQMQDLLQRYFSFASDNIRLILDRDATCAAIQDGLRWLAQDGSETDAVRVFHFAGHGSYVHDDNGDEPDGRDECLVPYDYRSAGLITDDLLKAIYDTFPPQGNLTLVMDSCHSGSVQRAPAEDITFRFLPVSDAEQEKIDAAAARFGDDQREFVTTELMKLRDTNLSDNEFRQKIASLMAVFEKKRFGDIRVREANLLLAGCRADQQAADARIDGDYHGAFTFYFTDAIRQAGGDVTYREAIEQTSARLRAEHFAQKPQLEYRAGRDQRPIFHPFA